MTIQSYKRYLKDTRPKVYAEVLRLYKKLCFNGAVEAFVENAKAQYGWKYVTKKPTSGWWDIVMEFDQMILSVKMPVTADELLTSAFTWTDSIEGDAFWRKMYDELLSERRALN